LSGENLRFVLWVKTLPCCAHSFDPTCSAGYVEAHHAGDRPFGRKAHDETCIPLCTKHHREWHDAGGVFRFWKKDQRRSWRDEMVAKTTAAFALEDD
jgi:hypothetical protein